MNKLKLHHKGFDLLFPSLPGHGRSPTPPDHGFNVDFCARSVEALIMQIIRESNLTYDKLIIFGYSYGATIGMIRELGYSADLPEQIDFSSLPTHKEPHRRSDLDFLPCAISLPIPSPTGTLSQFHPFRLLE